MPQDRSALIVAWVRELIHHTCLTQGWNSDDYEFAVTFAQVRARTGPAVVWQVLVSLDSGLIGKPPLSTTTTIPGARPRMEDVADRVVQAMTALWQAKLSMLGAKTAQPAQPVPPAAGKLIVAK